MPYGQSSLDDDWNTYAEQVLGHGASFAALIQSYPRMRGKAAILREADARLDPSFTARFEADGLTAAVRG